MSWKLACSLIAVLVCSSNFVSGDEADHKVVVSDPMLEPIIKMTIDDREVLGSYYDKTLKAANYPLSRKEFDIKLVGALTEFGYDFVKEVVVKNSYIITIGPKYIAKMTSLVAKFVPEFNRQMAAGGPKTKNGFIGDALKIWTSISKYWTVDPEVREKVKSEVPKSKEEFMIRYRDFLDICQIVVKNNPVGMYIDWNKLNVGGKDLAELGAPFVLYLQENGYKRAVGIMDSMMSIVAKVKTSS